MYQKPYPKNSLSSPWGKACRPCCHASFFIIEAISSQALFHPPAPSASPIGGKRRVAWNSLMRNMRRAALYDICRRRSRCTPNPCLNHAVLPRRPRRGAGSLEVKCASSYMSLLRLRHAFAASHAAVSHAGPRPPYRFSSAISMPENPHPASSLRCTTRDECTRVILPVGERMRKSEREWEKGRRRWREVLPVVLCSPTRWAAKKEAGETQTRRCATVRAKGWAEPILRNAPKARAYSGARHEDAGTVIDDTTHRPASRPAVRTRTATTSPP